MKGMGHPQKVNRKGITTGEDGFNRCCVTSSPSGSRGGGGRRIHQKARRVFLRWGEGESKEIIVHRKRAGNAKGSYGQPKSWWGRNAPRAPGGSKSLIKPFQSKKKPKDEFKNDRGKDQSLQRHALLFLRGGERSSKEIQQIEAEPDQKSLPLWGRKNCQKKREKRLNPLGGRRVQFQERISRKR